MLLTSTNHSLRAVLAGSVNSTQPQFQCDYADLTASAFTPGVQFGSLNGTTPVTIVNAPGSSTARQTKTVNIVNNDDADVTILIYFRNSSTDYLIHEVTLDPGKTVSWTPEHGWSDGGVPGPIGADGDDGVSFIWRDAWDSGTEYVENDVVEYDGSSYIALQTGTNQQPDTATTYWALMAAAGADGEDGEDGDDGADGTNTVAVEDDGSAIATAGTLNFTGSGVTVTDSGGGAVEIAIPGGGGSTNLFDVQIFTTTGSNTWNKPANAVTVNRYLIGGGGGGGAGRRGANSSIRGGGGGGGGGGYSADSNPASQFGSSETVTVGAGGAGATFTNASDTSGATGTTGGNTSMTATGTGGSTLTANGGVGGVGGTNSSGGAGGAGGTGTVQNGATGATGGGATGANAGSASSQMAGGGGGAGWGTTAANNLDSGGNSGNSGGKGGRFGYFTGSVAGTGGNDGYPGSAVLINGRIPALFGGGGGGGGIMSTVTSGNVFQYGGEGNYYGGGGGGGGGCTNGATSFNQGGVGGNGIAIIVTECTP